MKLSAAVAVVLGGVIAACGAGSLTDKGGAGDAGMASPPIDSSVEGATPAESGTSDGPSDGGAAPVDDGGGAGDAYDPFAPQPDPGGGLTDISTDLNAVLENGALAGACDKLDAGATDRKTELLCGKWMFFYDAFATSGIPAALVQFMASNFPDQLGLGFSKLGLVPDPSSTTNMPLGMAPTVPLGGTADAAGTVSAVAFTCASCHFAKMSDGRYAVGAPNLGYDYARHVLDISLAPTLGMGLSQPSAHDPAAVALVQPVLDALNASSTLKTQLVTALLPLISLKQPTLTTQVEHDYATWPTGTMDFLIAPLPVDDQVHIVSKIPPIWGIPSVSEATMTGMANGLLGSTGDTPSLQAFLWGFAMVGGAPSAPTEAQRQPLVDYIESLRAPANPNPPDPNLVTTGAALYRSKGCIECHGAPRGSGKRAYTFAEIGTDPTLAEWADPTMSPSACCGVPTPEGGMTLGVKSPRLVGMWTADRILHNGALSSLDQLFCRDGDAGRPAVGVAPQRTDGHDFTCTGLSDDDKRALEAYLLSH